MHEEVACGGCMKRWRVVDAGRGGVWWMHEEVACGGCIKRWRVVDAGIGGAWWMHEEVACCGTRFTDLLRIILREIMFLSQ